MLVPTVGGSTTTDPVTVFIVVTTVFAGIEESAAINVCPTYVDEFDEKLYPDNVLLPATTPALNGVDDTDAFDRKF